MMAAFMAQLPADALPGRALQQEHASPLWPCPRPRHELVLQALLELHARGCPIEASAKDPPLEHDQLALKIVLQVAVRRAWLHQLLQVQALHHHQQLQHTLPR